jgi:glutamate synthase domain-containing protein 3
MTSTTLNPILNAEDLFDSLKKEQREPETRKIEIKKSERLEQIIRGFEEALKINHYFFYPKEAYNISNKLITILPTSKEILDFSILMNDYQDYSFFEIKSGQYLNALINQSEDNEFTINTRHLERLPNSIGYKNNGKIIRINGDAGDFLGEKMQEGVIYTENTGNFLGINIENGTINVKNAGDRLGYSMQDGTIYVNNAGKSVGDGMQCGTIHIGNSYKSLANTIHGGNIYHQGRLIVKDGVKLI